MKLSSSWPKITLEKRRQMLTRLISGSLGEDELFEYLDLVRAQGHKGVYASTGLHFKYAIFGRDSLTVAKDLLAFQPDLARDVLITLARLQGQKEDRTSEEEPGKIPHEHRTVRVDGQLIPEYSLKILRNLQRVWGGEGSDNMLYYGSYDATPLFIRLLGLYVERYGDTVLKEEITGLENQTYTLADSWQAALGWLVQKLQNSESGLLEYHRLNPEGLANQAWKDSATGYLFADGSLPNFEAGIASVELQGYAYDALVYSDKYLASSFPLRSLAHRLQVQTIKLLWMKDLRYFAQGMDYGPNGSQRQIDSLTSNGALLLDSCLLEDLPKPQGQTYSKAVADIINGPEFMTDVGIRSRALRHSAMPGYVDYHGTYTVWPRETYAVACGLRRFGFRDEAKALEDRILRSVAQAGGFYELFYVNTDGSVYYDVDMARRHLSSSQQQLAIPETGQAWTISAVLSIMASRLRSNVNTA